MLVSLTSCATVASDSKDPVIITSDVNGAKITITDNNNCVVYQRKTPAMNTLEARIGSFRRVLMILCTPLQASWHSGTGATS